jgi:hypothetical protein
MRVFKNLTVKLNQNQLLDDSGVQYQKVSEVHLDFVNCAVDLFNPTLKEYGFKLLKLQNTEFGSKIIWIKGNCYIELWSNTHPHDSPSFYGVLLGEFKGDHYHYMDTDCVGLWRLEAIEENLDNVDDTPFPQKDDMQTSLESTKEDLLKYGSGFLQGDMNAFYEARNRQWKNHD